MADKRKENIRNYSGYSRSVDSDTAAKKKKTNQITATGCTVKYQLKKNKSKSFTK